MSLSGALARVNEFNIGKGDGFIIQTTSTKVLEKACERTFVSSDEADIAFLYCKNQNIHVHAMNNRNQLENCVRYLRIMYEESINEGHLEEDRRSCLTMQGYFVVENGEEAETKTREVSYSSHPIFMTRQTMKHSLLQVALFLEGLLKMDEASKFEGSSALSEWLKATTGIQETVIRGGMTSLKLYLWKSPTDAEHRISQEKWNEATMVDDRMLVSKAHEIFPLEQYLNELEVERVNQSTFYNCQLTSLTKNWKIHFYCWGLTPFKTPSEILIIDDLAEKFNAETAPIIDHKEKKEQITDGLNPLATSFWPEKRAQEVVSVTWDLSNKLSRQQYLNSSKRQALSSPRTAETHEEMLDRMDSINLKCRKSSKMAPSHVLTKEQDKRSSEHLSANEEQDPEDNYSAKRAELIYTPTNSPVRFPVGKKSRLDTETIKLVKEAFEAMNKTKKEDINSKLNSMLNNKVTNVNGNEENCMPKPLFDSEIMTDSGKTIPSNPWRFCSTPNRTQILKHPDCKRLARRLRKRSVMKDITNSQPSTSDQCRYVSYE